MITRGSPLYRAAIDDAELSRERAKVLIDLCRSRTSFVEVALALNCPEGVARSLLAHPFGAAYAAKGKTGTAEEIDLDTIPQAQFRAISHSDAAQRVLEKERQKLALKLVIEVHRWLASFRVSDLERQQAVERAGLQLDKRTSTWDGKYLFPARWLVLDLLGIGSSLCPPIGHLDFRSDVSLRLATWIQFWIADPIIWNQALDLEYAFLGANSQVTTAATSEPAGGSDIEPQQQEAA